MTGEEIRAYRDMLSEERELRALMRRAEWEVRRMDREEDRARAREAAAMYESAAEKLALRLAEIEVEIEAVRDSRARRVLRMRYIDGLSRAAVAVRMEISEAMVDKWCARGMSEIESGR